MVDYLLLARASFALDRAFGWGRLAALWRALRPWVEGPLEPPRKAV